MCAFLWGFVIGGAVGIFLTGLATAAGKDRNEDEDEGEYK